MALRTIPEALIADRATVVLVTRWRNLLQEYAICKKRVNWNTTRNPSAVEKRRRRRRWEIESLLSDIENTLIAFLADGTHHPDLWTAPTAMGDPLDKDTFCKLDRLYRKYYATKRRPGAANVNRTTVDKKQSKQRRSIVQEIANLKWIWLVSLYKAMFPTAAVPPKREVDLRVLRPKRIRRLSAPIPKQTTRTHGVSNEEKQEGEARQEQKENRKGRRQKEA